MSSEGQGVAPPAADGGGGRQQSAAVARRAQQQAQQLWRACSSQIEACWPRPAHPRQHNGSCAAHAQMTGAAHGPWGPCVHEPSIAAHSLLSCTTSHARPRPLSPCSGIEAKQPNSAIRKCARVQLIKNGKKIAAFVPNDGCLNFIEENVSFVGRGVHWAQGGHCRGCLSWVPACALAASLLCLPALACDGDADGSEEAGGMLTVSMLQRSLWQQRWQQQRGFHLASSGSSSSDHSCAACCPAAEHCSRGAGAGTSARGRQHATCRFPGRVLGSCSSQQLAQQTLGTGLGITWIGALAAALGN